MTRRVLIGQFPGGAYGLRCSKPGYDVLTPNPAFNELTFDSTWTQTLPVHCASGIVGIGPGGSATIGFSTGGLAYVPMSQTFFAFSHSGPWQAFNNSTYSYGNGTAFTTRAPARISNDGANFYFTNLTTSVSLYFFAIAFKLRSGM